MEDYQFKPVWFSYDDMWEPETESENARLPGDEGEPEEDLYGLNAKWQEEEDDEEKEDYWGIYDDDNG